MFPIAPNPPQSSDDAAQLVSMDLQPQSGQSVIAALNPAGLGARGNAWLPHGPPSGPYGEPAETRLFR